MLLYMFMMLHAINIHLAGHSILRDLLSDTDRMNGQSMNKHWFRLAVLSRSALAYLFVDPMGFWNQPIIR